jgi:hypothetical protein
LLAYIGAHIIPFTTEAYSKWKEDKTARLQEMTLMKSTNDMIIAHLLNDSTGKIAREKRFQDIESDIQSLATGEQDLLQTISIQNSTISLIQNRLNNKSFIRGDE